jgi:hypothetical protein
MQSGLIINMGFMWDNILNGAGAALDYSKLQLIRKYVQSTVSNIRHGKEPERPF